MLYLVYDCAKHGLQNLLNLKAAFKYHDMLLDKQYDCSLEFVAPWIFQIEEEQMDVFRSMDLPTQDLLWFDSKVEMQDIIKAFQKVIYNGDPEFAPQYFRIWDIQIMVGELSKPNTESIQSLFKVIDNFYLLKDEMMKMYYLDFWGVLNTKTAQNIVLKKELCHNRLQE